MDDKPKPRKLKSTVENAEYRSGYGDMHAHRNAEMMKEHVALVREAGMIDEHMASELLKPLHVKRTWTPEYLSTFPTYTGQQSDMVSFETAERLRRKRDKEQLKIVEDFEAGLIDEDGNRIVQDGDDDAAEVGSESSPLTDATELENRVDAHPTTGTKTLVLRSRSSSTTSVPEPAVAPASAPPSPPPAPPSESVPAKRMRKRPEKVDPLQPLAGGKDYQAYKYHELVAVGRERGIYTPGNTQAVRNALIQDDINIAQGLERNVADWKKKVHTYKTFKTKVPDELKTRLPAELEEGEEEDGEEM